MTAIAVAGDCGIQQKAAVEALGANAQVLRIVLAAADPELLLPFGHRRQQLEQCRHRAVVQEGRRRPDAVQRACLVAAQFLHADWQAEAVEFRALGLADAGVTVGALLDIGGDIGQPLALDRLARSSGPDDAPYSCTSRRSSSSWVQPRRVRSKRWSAILSAVVGSVPTKEVGITFMRHSGSRSAAKRLSTGLGPASWQCAQFSLYSGRPRLACSRSIAPSTSSGQRGGVSCMSVVSSLCRSRTRTPDA